MSQQPISRKTIVYRNFVEFFLSSTTAIILEKQISEKIKMGHTNNGKVNFKRKTFCFLLGYPGAQFIRPSHTPKSRPSKKKSPKGVNPPGNQKEGTVG